MEASNWIALGAVGISTIALTIALIETLSNKPKLRVLVSSAAKHPNMPGVAQIDSPRAFRSGEVPAGASLAVSVEITNYGRQPTTIKGLGFRPKGMVESAHPKPISFGEDTGASLPVQISPGEYRKFFFSADDEIKFKHQPEALKWGDFVFGEKPDLLVRHSWKSKPMIVRNLQKK